MGNCGGICNRNLLKSKGDVIISEQETGQSLDQNDMKKLIYLQRAIKNFIKRVISKKKLNKIKKLSNNNRNKMTLPQSDKELKLSKDSPKKSNKSKKSKNKYITYDEEPTTNELLIPTVNTPLMDNNIFNDDPFRKKKMWKKKS